MADTPLDHPRRAAVFYPYIAPVLRHAGWFGMFFVLAPIIGPHGYGVFILALSGVAIADAILAEPLTRALAGLGTVEPRHWSTALVTMMIGGGALWLTARAGAPLLDALVDEPGFPDMFQTLAILPLLGGLAVVPTALLRRQGREGTLIAASVAGFAVGASIALSLAWAGAGPWSLVAQIIVQRLVECLVLWALPGEQIGLAWSARHFADLAEAMDTRTLSGIWPAVSRYGQCLAVGLMLGPIAAALYLLAMQLAEVLCGIVPVGTDSPTPDALVHHTRRVLLPAVMASALLPVALPPLIDLRWWGAVPAAQLLLFGAIPSMIISVCRQRAAVKELEPRWCAVEALGCVVVAALLGRGGLVAVAAGNLVWVSAVALIALWRARLQAVTSWRDLIRDIRRPCGGALLAGLFLGLFTTPVSLALPALSALSLLTGLGGLIYLVVRGDAARSGETAGHLSPLRKSVA